MNTLDAQRSAAMELAQDLSPDRLVHQERYEALAEIGRVSVHIAALEEVVLPSAERAVPGGGELADDLRRKGAELSAALYRLERRISGDGRARETAGRLLEEVTALVADYAERERALLTSLVHALDSASLGTLVETYHGARLRVPTRPHPTLSAHPLLRRLSWRFAGPVDRLRDALDNRPVPENVAADAALALATLDRFDAAGSAGAREATPASVAAGGPEVGVTTDKRAVAAA